LVKYFSPNQEVLFRLPYHQDLTQLLSAGVGPTSQTTASWFCWSAKQCYYLKYGSFLATKERKLPKSILIFQGVTSTVTT